MRRLIHLSHYPAAYPGSFVPMVRALAAGARDRGWDVQVVFGADSAACGWIGDFERDGTPLRFVELGSRRTLRREVAGLLAESDLPTVLHTQFTAFDVPAALAARRRPGTGVVWQLQSPARTDPLGWARGVVKLGVLGRLADRIVCVAPDLAEAVRRRGAPRDRVVFVPNATDTSAFGLVSAADRAQARAQLDLPPHEPVLLHFGWDWQRKGGDLFLEAVRALLDRGRRVTALAVGGGEAATELAQRLGIADAVVVRGPEQRVQLLYAASDLFVSPSRAEGTPFSMLEALASGVPVAASSIPGQEVVGRGLSACRLVPLDALALADAVESLLDRGGESAAADAAAAAARVRSEYDLQTWVERMLALYESVLRDSSQSRT